MNENSDDLPFKKNAGGFLAKEEEGRFVTWLVTNQRHSLHAMPTFHHHRLRPSKALRSVIQYYDWYDFTDPCEGDSLTFYPTFETGLVFLFYRDQPILIQSPATPLKPLETCALLPPRTTWVHQSQIRNLSLCLVMAHPGGMYTLFHQPMKRFQNRLLPAAEALGSRISCMHEQMAEDPRPTRCQEVVDEYLLSCLGREKRKPLFERLNACLRRLGGNVHAKALAECMGYTLRHLNRRISTELGFSTKEFLRNHRFIRSLRYLQRAKCVSLSQVALKFGFYDQAHFSREFKRMTNESPSQYLKSLGTTNMPVKGGGRHFFLADGCS